MGLSQDPAARERQLDGLKRGRVAQARALLGMTDEEPPAPPAKPEPPAKPKAKSRRTISYPKGGENKNGGRPKAASPKPPEPAPEPEPEPAEERSGGGFFAGLFAGE